MLFISKYAIHRRPFVKMFGNFAIDLANSL